MPRRALPVITCLLSLCIAGCDGLPGAGGDRGARGRVLIVGIDGASPRVTGPLLEQGRLPTLAALRRDGAAGPLRSELPLISPRVWNTIATGKRPEAHGVEDFTWRDAAGRRRLYGAEQRGVPALWNIASAAGLRVGVVNWWTTYPPDVVRGIVVSDHARADKAFELGVLTGVSEPVTGPTVFPREYGARVAELAGDTRPLVDVPDPFRDLPERLSRYYVQDGQAVRVALDVESRLRPELLMVFLPGIDRVSHVLWAALEPAERYPADQRLTPAERARGAAALQRYYEYTDALIALLLERFGPDDLVLVLSDHGFEAGDSARFDRVTGQHESEAAIDGVLFMRGPGVAAGSSSAGAGIADVTPSVLAWLGLPVGADMDGRVLPQLGVSDPERIASHDGIAVERLAGEASGREPQILEGLKALGYLE